MCPRCNYVGQLKWVTDSNTSLYLRCDSCNINHRAGYAQASDKFELMGFKCPIDNFPVIRHQGKYGTTYVSP